jgi:hypothetical protein
MSFFVISESGYLNYLENLCKEVNSDCPQQQQQQRWQQHQHYRAPTNHTVYAPQQLCSNYQLPALPKLIPLEEFGLEFDAGNSPEVTLDPYPGDWGFSKSFPEAFPSQCFKNNHLACTFDSRYRYKSETAQPVGYISGYNCIDNTSQFRHFEDSFSIPTQGESSGSLNNCRTIFDRMSIPLKKTVDERPPLEDMASTSARAESLTVPVLRGPVPHMDSYHQQRLLTPIMESSNKRLLMVSSSRTPLVVPTYKAPQQSSEARGVYTGTSPILSVPSVHLSPAPAHSQAPAHSPAKTTTAAADQTDDCAPLNLTVTSPVKKPVVVEVLPEPMNLSMAKKPEVEVKQEEDMEVVHEAEPMDLQAQVRDVIASNQDKDMEVDPAEMDQMVSGVLADLERGSGGENSSPETVDKESVDGNDKSSHEDMDKGSNEDMDKASNEDKFSTSTEATISELVDEEKPDREFSFLILFVES